MLQTIRRIILAGAAVLGPWHAVAAQEAAGPRAVPAARVAHAATAGMLGTALAGQRAVAVGDHGVVLLSDDGGQRWRQARAVPVDSTLTAVSFADAEHGWAVGHAGVILATQDGGETWRLQRRAAQEDRPLFAVHMFDAQHGVAVGLWSLVLVTGDAGKTWDSVALSPPEGAKRADLNLFSLFTTPTGELLATAERGMLLRSTDRGQHWAYLASGYKGSFWAGAAASDGVLLAAGLRGSIFRSADDGKTWARVDNPGKASITALLATGQNVLALGLDGSVLRSQDGGASFNTEQRDDRAALTSALRLADGRELLFSRQGPLPDRR
ncbi:WD40/YVTN/BNR-like repeat-containing protein [Ideonella sp.]|uniref:WD40/YVTN/BNR-like repeat-containing protein n=1 Tax=Ideonella sp. TaxID=1929293 RepID=UPI002B4A67EB|nr:YCF48-related protein [Ideonella sp.]HJV68858.1 YCF48-related protein [Ideonella sp.]